ncbi:MAG: hypothetical protein A3G81_06390 [Betaproteobacteria bacterium RIFCSPLOWO2_12_FULL_65_14]|nr:MAG: hypothetical protein A3G81_06390 [Betaproteobacteria bacterium RIFCSPLOWO2_12_FULL_65_14]
MGAHVAYPERTPAGAIMAIMEIWDVNDTMPARARFSRGRTHGGRTYRKADADRVSSTLEPTAAS